MQVLLIIVIVFIIAHAVLIETYRKWFLLVKEYVAPADYEPSLTFSVVIPARNEEKAIEKCLLSVLQQSYPTPLFEVIVVDDFSSDNTAHIVKQLQGRFTNLKLIQLSHILGNSQINSYKKKAIETAIKHAANNYIVATDADCITGEHWLRNFASFIQHNNSVFVAAPVKYINDGSFLSIFQSLDFISLQGITAATVNSGFHSMCNGANLVYEKQKFYEVNGFKGIDTIASGDDMLLMHKIFLQSPSKVHFLLSGESVVSTHPMPTWKSFLNQRIRWASKADKYNDKKIIAVLLFVYVFNASFILLAVLSFWINGTGWILLMMLAAKTIIDLRFMIPVARFFKEEKLLLWFPLMQPFHILYTVFAGWLGKFGKYTWKGREVK